MGVGAELAILTVILNPGFEATPGDILQFPQSMILMICGQPRATIRCR